MLVLAEIWLGLLVLALAAYVFSRYGFDGPLYRDLSIYLYGGQRVAEGIPPYVGIFDHKGPLPHLLAGLGVILGRWWGIGDVYGARLVFFVFGCFGVLAMYLFGRSTFSSRTAGYMAALSMMGYYSFARPVASGPEPKTPLILFQALSLMLMGQKRWFWAGLTGSLAALVWQPTAVLPAACVLLAVTRPRAERANATLRAVSGAALPMVLTFLYYLYNGAIGALAQGYLLFNLLRVDRHGDWLWRVIDPEDPGAVWRWNEVVRGHELSLVAIFLGLAFVVALAFAKPFRYRYLPILITLPLFVLWTFYDFQSREDFYIILPYAAIGFAGLVTYGLRGLNAPRFVAGLPALVLLLVALVNTPLLGDGKGPGFDLQDQQRSVAELRARFGPEPRVASINAPQPLVLLNQRNPNPFLFTTDRVDREISVETPGGFPGWVDSLKAYDPQVVAYFADGQRQMPEDGMDERNVHELFSWLNAEYRKEKIGNFWYYVKKTPASSPSATSGGRGPWGPGAEGTRPAPP